MELDFSDFKFSGSGNGAWITGISLLVALLLGVLGWFVLPEGKVLTWTEWQVFKQQRTYQRELVRLTADADRLAKLLDESIPEPVRSQLVLESILADLNATTHPALKNQVNAMLIANDAVYWWVLGSGTKNDAILLLDSANQGLLNAIEAQEQ